MSSLALTVISCFFCLMASGTWASSDSCAWMAVLTSANSFSSSAFLVLSWSSFGWMLEEISFKSCTDFVSSLSPCLFRVFWSRRVWCWDNLLWAFFTIGAWSSISETAIRASRRVGMMIPLFSERNCLIGSTSSKKSAIFLSSNGNILLADFEFLQTDTLAERLPKRFRLLLSNPLS